MYSNLLLLGAMTQKQMFMVAIPWAIVVAVGLGAARWYQMNRAKKIQDVVSKLIKMGSIDLVEGGNDLARGDGLAFVKWLEKEMAKYSGPDGPLKFTWDVIKMGGDDVLNDTQFGYGTQFGDWIEDQMMGILVEDDSVQADLVNSANAMRTLHMDEAAALVDALSRNKPAAVRTAIQALVTKYRDASKVNDNLVAWLVQALPVLVADAANRAKIFAAIGVQDSVK